MKTYILLVPEVRYRKVEVLADNLDSALNDQDAQQSDLSDEIVEEYNYTLDVEEYKVQLPSGEIVPADEALDLEGADELVGF